MIKTALGLALGLSLYGSITASSVWTPAQWFLASEQGGWWQADIPDEIYAIRNLLTYSEDLSNAVWVKNSVSVSGNRVTPTAATAAHGVSQTVSETGLTTMTASARLKADGYNKIALVDTLHSAYGSLVVDLRDGSTASITNSIGTTTVTSEGSGWYRVTWAYSGYPSGGATYRTEVRVLPDSGVTNSFSGTWLADGVGGVLVEQFQFEKGVATAYQSIPTTRAAAYIAGAAAAGKQITNWQDSAGTIPVTAVEQSVGLVLDRRLGLVRGPELATGAPTLSGGATYSAGVITIPGSPSGAIAKYTLGGHTAGKWYEVIFDIQSIVSGGSTCEIRMGVTGNEGLYYTGYASSVGNKKRIVFQATGVSAPNVNFWQINTGTGSTTFANISVRELPGNHLIQATTASKPKLSARKNLLTYTEDFSNAAWSTNGTVSVSANSSTDPRGGNTADTITFGAGATNRIRSVASITTGAVTATNSIYVRVASGTKTFRLFCYDASVGDIYGADMTATTSWQRFEAPTTRVGSAFYGLANGSNGAAGDIIVWGAQVEYGSVATTYQRVTTATDYDTVGFPHYLNFDGFDDFLATAGNVDFSATDKMTVVAGVTKLSDAATGSVFNLGSSAGIVRLYAPNTAYGGATFVANSLGSAGDAGDKNAAIGSSPSPTSAVIAVTSDIAGDLVRARKNGGSWVSATGDQGTGNYANAVLYVGRQQGTVFPYNGTLSSLVIRGAATADVTPGEAFAADLHGVTL